MTKETNMKKKVVLPHKLYAAISKLAAAGDAQLPEVDDGHGADETLEALNMLDEAMGDVELVDAGDD